MSKRTVVFSLKDVLEAAYDYGPSTITVPLDSILIPKEDENGNVVWERPMTAAEVVHLKRGIAKIASSDHKRRVKQIRVLSLPPIHPDTLVAFSSLKPDEYHKYTEAEIAKTSWKLEPDFPISSWAALFYILYARHAQGDTRATKLLDYTVARLVGPVKRYLDMAVGGELRHTISNKYQKEHGVPYVEKPALEPLVEEGVKAGWFKVKSLGETKVVQLIDPESGAFLLPEISKFHAGIERDQAWREWALIRKRVGVYALNWAAIGLASVVGSNIAGPLWANAAFLLRSHELGEVNDRFFIDQAFSLQHNGAPIFNKLWDIRCMQPLLDLAFAGDFGQLHCYLIPEHRRLLFGLMKGSTVPSQPTGRTSSQLWARTKRRVLRPNTRKSVVLGIGAKA